MLWRLQVRAPVPCGAGGRGFNSRPAATPVAQEKVSSILVIATLKGRRFGAPFSLGPCRQHVRLVAYIERNATADAPDEVAVRSCRAQRASDPGGSCPQVVRCITLVRWPANSPCGANQSAAAGADAAVVAICAAGCCTNLLDLHVAACLADTLLRGHSPRGLVYAVRARAGLPPISQPFVPRPVARRRMACPQVENSALFARHLSGRHRRYP